MIDIRYFLARQKADQEAALESSRQDKKETAVSSTRKVASSRSMRRKEPAGAGGRAARRAGFLSRKAKSSRGSES
jgi:hypothetical protein